MDQGNLGSGNSNSNSLPPELEQMLAHQGDASEALFKTFVHEAIRKSINTSNIADLCTDKTYQGNSIYKQVELNGGELYVMKTIAEILNKPLKPGERKTIRILRKDVSIDHLWRQIEQALIDAKCPVFVRNRRLVWPNWRPYKADNGKSHLDVALEDYNVKQLRDMIDHHAVQLEIWDGRMRGWRHIATPEDIVRTIIDMHHYNHLKNIIAPITSPTIRPDGSLLVEEGYDDETQLWFKSGDNVKLPAMPDCPSKDDGVKAVKKIKGLLKPSDNDEEGFPFADESSLAAALAGILTTVGRGAIKGPVPLFLITAPDPRTGKTFLVNLIGFIATGSIPISTAGAEKKEEFEKRIETAALAGRVILHLNNLPNGMCVESDRLAELATEGKVVIRKLGRHEEGMLDCRSTTCFLNGNNVGVSEDLVPRTVSCRLDAAREDPEARTFKFNPIAEVEKNRGEWLACAFTIIRAYRLAPESEKEEVRTKIKRVAGFEQWSEIAQQPLVWLGLADPMAGMEDMKGMDPKQELIERTQGALYDCFENEPFTVKQCEERARAGGPSNNLTLRDLMSVNGQINTRAFGCMLRSYRNKIRGGLKIELAKADPAHGHQWKIEGRRNM